MPESIYINVMDDKTYAVTTHIVPNNIEDIKNYIIEKEMFYTDDDEVIYDNDTIVINADCLIYIINNITEDNVKCILDAFKSVAEELFDY